MLSLFIRISPYLNLRTQFVDKIKKNYFDSVKALWLSPSYFSLYVFMQPVFFSIKFFSASIDLLFLAFSISLCEGLSFLTSRLLFIRSKMIDPFYVISFFIVFGIHSPIALVILFVSDLKYIITRSLYPIYILHNFSIILQ